MDSALRVRKNRVAVVSSRFHRIRKNPSFGGAMLGDNERSLWCDSGSSNKLRRGSSLAGGLTKERKGRYWFRRLPDLKDRTIHLVFDAVTFFSCKISDT